MYDVQVFRNAGVHSDGHVLISDKKLIYKRYTHSYKHGRQYNVGYVRKKGIKEHLMVSLFSRCSNS